MKRFVLFVSIFSFLCTLSLRAQIYPERTDMDRFGLRGPVQKIVDVSRAFSANLDKWEPLVITRIMNFNEDGNLLKAGIYVSREQPEQQFFVYKENSDSILPVLDATRSMFQNGEASPIQETLYAYEANGRLAGKIERDYQKKSVAKNQYFYQEDLLSAIVTRDSSTNNITAIEFFYYLNDGKPTGSSTRYFNRETDRITLLGDTSDIPEERINRSYTFYTYTDTLTPVIYWDLNMGSDTTVDKQIIKRFLDDGMLSASTTQTFNNGKTARSESILYNVYGDVLSSAVSFGNDTTYSRALDYVYDELDNEKNWRTRRQYATVADEEAKDKEKKILLSRTDRDIIYYE